MSVSLGSTLFADLFIFRLKPLFAPVDKSKGQRVYFRNPGMKWLILHCRVVVTIDYSKAVVHVVFILCVVLWILAARILSCFVKFVVLMWCV